MINCQLPSGRHQCTMGLLNKNKSTGKIDTRVLKHGTRYFYIFIMLSAFFLFPALPAYSQFLRLPVDTIIARVNRARGGIRQIEHIHTLQMTGTVQMQRVIAPMTISLKRPHKMRLEASVRNDTLIQAFDGKNAWSAIPQQGQKIPRPLPPSQAAQLKQQADIDGPLIHPARQGITVAFDDTAHIGGRFQYKLKLTRDNGTVTYIYVDAENYHMVRESSVHEIKSKKTAVPDKQVHISLHYSHFRKVDGISFPFDIKTYVNNQLVSDMKLRKITVNPPLPDSLFAMPAPSP